MKKTAFKLFGLFLIPFTLSGCGGGAAGSSEPASSPASVSQVDVLRRDFYDQRVAPGKMAEEIGAAFSPTLSDVGIKVIYGEFRGAFVLSYVVCRLGGKSFWNTAYTVTLGSNRYSFDVAWTPHVWAGSKVLSLENAYAASVIVEGDLSEIMRVAAIPVERFLV